MKLSFWTELFSMIPSMFRIMWTGTIMKMLYFLFCLLGNARSMGTENHTWDLSGQSPVSKLAGSSTIMQNQMCITRGFHVEVNPSWFANFRHSGKPGWRQHKNIGPFGNTSWCIMFLQETKLYNGDKPVGHRCGTGAIVWRAFPWKGIILWPKTPAWVKVIKDALHGSPESWKLNDLAKLANVHPVAFIPPFSQIL